MQYDPIKEPLGRLFNLNPFLRRVFYYLLDILLLRSWHVRRALKETGALMSPYAEVLDAGMGFGQYSWWMTRTFPGWKITAADIKSEQVADCNAFFTDAGVADTVKAVEADLVTWNSNERYDLVLCVDVMEHIEEDRTVFSNFFRSLNPGGKLIISTPSDRGGSDVHGENEESFIGEHVRDGYGIEEITAKLTGVGFSTVNASYTYGLPGSIAWKLSMKYPVTALSFSKLFFILLPLWYLVVIPFCLVLNLLDLNMKHKEGTGLLVTAEK